MSETEGTTPPPAENSTPPEAPASLPSTEAAPPEDEQIRKVYVKDLREKQRVHTVFRVSKKVKHTGRSGKSFLAVMLVDRTGEIDARIFDNVDAADSAFVEGDYLLVAGNVISYQKKPQLVIERLEKLDAGPLDPAEFTPGAQEAQEPSHEEPSPSGHEGGGDVPKAALNHLQHIRDFVNRVTDPHVKALLLAFLDDDAIAEGLKIAPAAKGIHHAYRGGLAEHIHSVMRLAHRIADHYPMADRDLLVAGALLHDIMKVKEISPEKGFEYTDEGRLVGHLVMTAQSIREKAARIDGFPPLLEQHITHIVLAHHGQLEWGSPKVPMTLEALLVHLIDTMDSRVASWLEFMARDPNDKWTDTSRLYERHLWKGPVPTARGRAPVPPRGGGGGGGGKRDKKNDRRRDEKRGASGPVVEHKPKHDRGPREEKPKPGQLPKDLTFKPFNALAGDQQPPGGNEGGGSTNA